MVCLFIYFLSSVCHQSLHCTDLILNILTELNRATLG